MGTSAIRGADSVRGVTERRWRTSHGQGVQQVGDRGLKGESDYHTETEESAGMSAPRQGMMLH